MKASVSILVPFYNEEENGTPLLNEIRLVCDGLPEPYETIFVNDGSTDATGRRLDELTQDWPQARTLHCPNNHGQAAALSSAMKQATGEVLVTLHGDGQSDPAEIPKLLAALRNFDMVAGVRVRRRDLLVRLAMSRLANRVRSAVLGGGLPLIQPPPL